MGIQTTSNEIDILICGKWYYNTTYINWTCSSSYVLLFTVQKIKFSIKDFFSKCDQMHSFWRIW